MKGVTPCHESAQAIELFFCAVSPPTLHILCHVGSVNEGSHYYIIIIN